MNSLLIKIFVSTAFEPDFVSVTNLGCLKPHCHRAKATLVFFDSALRIAILGKSIEESFELVPMLNRKQGQVPHCNYAGGV